MKKTFYFNTGVKLGMNPYLHEKAVIRGVIGGGFCYVIPFVCENVPEGATFSFACDNANLYPETGYVVAPILKGTLLQSKFAYFSAPYKA